MPNGEGGEDVYFSCPRKFIPSEIWDFLEQLEYLDKYPHTAPAYHDQDPRFANCKRYYLGKVSEYTALVEREG